jgi:hypothetical protein
MAAAFVLALVGGGNTEGIGDGETTLKDGVQTGLEDQQPVDIF